MSKNDGGVKVLCTVVFTGIMYLFGFFDVDYSSMSINDYVGFFLKYMFFYICLGIVLAGILFTLLYLLHRI